MNETRTQALWFRMMAAAQLAAARRGWRAAANIRRAWTQWYYRQLYRPRLLVLPDGSRVVSEEQWTKDPWLAHIQEGGD